MITKVWQDGIKKGLKARLAELLLCISESERHDSLFNIWSETVFEIMSKYMDEKSTAKHDWAALPKENKIKNMEGRNFSFEKYTSTIESTLQTWLLPETEHIK